VARIKGAFRLFLKFRLVASFCFCKKKRFVAQQNYYCIDYCAVWRASKVPLDFFKIPPCGELLFLQENALCGASKLLLY
jgi:hypothetical protein